MSRIEVLVRYRGSTILVYWCVLSAGIREEASSVYMCDVFYWKGRGGDLLSLQSQLPWWPWPLWALHQGTPLMVYSLYC